MKKKIVLLCAVYLTLGIQVLSVNAADHSVETNAGIAFTEEEEPKDPADPVPEEPGSQPSTEEPEVSGETTSTETNTSGTGTSKDSGGILPQTGDTDSPILPFTGGGLLIVILYAAGMKKQF